MIRHGSRAAHPGSRSGRRWHARSRPVRRMDFRPAPRGPWRFGADAGDYLGQPMSTRQARRKPPSLARVGRGLDHHRGSRICRPSVLSVFQVSPCRVSRGSLAPFSRHSVASRFRSSAAVAGIVLGVRGSRVPASIASCRRGSLRRPSPRRRSRSPWRHSAAAIAAMVVVLLRVILHWQRSARPRRPAPRGRSCSGSRAGPPGAPLRRPHGTTWSRLPGGGDRPRHASPARRSPGAAPRRTSRTRWAPPPRGLLHVPVIDQRLSVLFCCWCSRSARATSRRYRGLLGLALALGPAHPVVRRVSRGYRTSSRRSRDTSAVRPDDLLLPFADRAAEGSTRIEASALAMSAASRTLAEWSVASRAIHHVAQSHVSGPRSTRVSARPQRERESSTDLPRHYRARSARRSRVALAIASVGREHEHRDGGRDPPGTCHR